MKPILKSFAFLALAVASHAEPAAAPSFENDLREARSTVMESLKAGKAARALADAATLQRLAWDASRADSEASRLRWDVSRARQRAQQLAREGGGKRDPIFESDLRRLVWELRNLEGVARELERAAAAEDARAGADPSLADAAQRLLDDARSLRSSASWLQDETRWARWDISRAGYNLESWDVERHGDEIRRASGETERSARSLLQKIRG